MPVKTDNIDEIRREALRAQGRARQARHAAKKRAERAATLMPKVADIDEALIRSLLATEKPDVIAGVIKGAFEALRASGFQDVKPSMRRRCSELKPPEKPKAPEVPSAEGETTSPETRGADTYVTPTDKHADPPLRIADPTPA